jgi:hypothetical protein
MKTNSDSFTKNEVEGKITNNIHFTKNVYPELIQHQINLHLQLILLATLQRKLLQFHLLNQTTQLLLNELMLQLLKVKQH